MPGLAEGGDTELRTWERCQENGTPGGSSLAGLNTVYVQ